jgi:hypothetical protein
LGKIFLKGELDMNSKLGNTNNNKGEDGKFSKKNIKHRPKDESSRAIFGAKDNQKHLD